MQKLIRKLATAREGATAIEYGLIAAFIALAMVVALPSIKTNLSAKFTAVGTELGKDGSSTSSSTTTQ